jgi:hypothetical protein
VFHDGSIIAGGKRRWQAISKSFSTRSVGEILLLGLAICAEPPVNHTVAKRNLDDDGIAGRLLAGVEHQHALPIDGTGGCSGSGGIRNLARVFQATNMVNATAANPTAAVVPMLCMLKLLNTLPKAMMTALMVMMFPRSPNFFEKTRPSERSIAAEIR